MSLREESEDTTWYEPYAPRVMRDYDPAEDNVEHAHKMGVNPALVEVTSGEGSKVVDVVTVDHRVHHPNNTKNVQPPEQALLHPDIQATTGFHSHIDNSVETA